jgi:hypothetical protein
LGCQILDKCILAHNRGHAKSSCNFDSPNNKNTVCKTHLCGFEGFYNIMPQDHRSGIRLHIQLVHNGEHIWLKRIPCIRQEYTSCYPLLGLSDQSSLFFCWQLFLNFDHVAIMFDMLQSNQYYLNKFWPLQGFNYMGYTYSCQKIGLQTLWHTNSKQQADRN